MTLSLGAASYPADADNAADLLERAREALEEARSFGRNRVWCYLRRPRVPVQVPVYFDGTESTLLGFSLDLFPSGVFVKTPTPVVVGMRCALTFPLPGTTGNVHVVGRVVRTVPAEYAPPSEHRAPGMGIEFERLGPADRRALHAFFHQHDLPTRRPGERNLQRLFASSHPDLRPDPLVHLPETRQRVHMIVERAIRRVLLRRQRQVITPSQTVVVKNPVITDEIINQLVDAASYSTERIRAKICDICGYYAKSNAGLASHKRLAHKGGT